MSDDTNLDNRLAQGRWESVHANDFALLDTPEQRIGVLKELLDNLKKGIGEAKGRPPAVTAEDAGTLAEGGRYSELKHCVDREGLLARLEQESNTPELSSSETHDFMHSVSAVWRRDLEPPLRFQLQTEGPELPEADQRKIIEEKKQGYLLAQRQTALEAKQERARKMLELAPRVWAAQDRQREDEQAWQMSRSFKADQRLLITKLDEARLDEARREEARASAPPQPVPQEPPAPPQPLSEEAPEPEDTKDKQEGPELEGVQDTQEAQPASGTQGQEAGGEDTQDRQVILNSDESGSDQSLPTDTEKPDTTRKPHTAYAAYAKGKGISMARAWGEIKQLAGESGGDTKVNLPGWTGVFLKNHPMDPEDTLRYFDHAYYMGKPKFSKAFVKKFYVPMRVVHDL